MAVEMNPPAELPARDGDVPLAYDRFQRISLFARLKKRVKPEKHPGKLVLRHYRRGEVLWLQGAPGWTAHYALTAASVVALRDEILQAADPEERDRRREEIERLGEQLRVKRAGRPEPGRVATVHIALPRPPEARPKGLFGWLGLGRAAPAEGPAAPRYIPIDAPNDIDYEERKAPLFEGDLFGEMSCVAGSPRSGTVVADRDWYFLEMLRNLLDDVQDDPNYRDEADRVYRQRALDIQLRRLSIIGALSEEQYEKVRKSAELVRYRVNEVIFHENDRPDSMYIVRGGVVKTVKNASELVGPADVPKDKWPGLCAALRAGEAQPAEAVGLVWQALPEEARRAARRPPAELTEADKTDLIYGLNGIVKAPPLPGGAALPGWAQGLPPDPKKWAEADRWRYGRLFLEAALPGLLRPRAGVAGREYVLSYQQKGEFIGEIGALTGAPRTATCLAYAHPDPGQGHHGAGKVAPWRRNDPVVELVRLPAELFRRLLEESKAAEKQVQEEVARRKKQSQRLASLDLTDSRRETHLTGAFEGLGLIQGQQLMLIDLDRCTRCDECVRACVATHADGRARLFLDGPRFGKYLVPTTCRSCIDPVCLFGCPVGAIHRGDNRQIVIEDWCIGCGLCATNCPYDAIQMHDVGVVAEGSHGWHYRAAAGAGGDRWKAPPGRLDLLWPGRGWKAGRAPFRNDRDFRKELGVGVEDPAALAAGVCFCRPFEVDAAALGSVKGYKLTVTSPDTPTEVWVNGRPLTTEAKYHRGEREYPIPAKAGPLRAGTNVVAVRVTPTGADLEVLLDLRLDEEHSPHVPKGLSGEVREKEVTERAVVCDLCSQEFGRRPACVTACPHDAAMRVNARLDFPAG